MSVLLMAISGCKPCLEKDNDYLDSAVIGNMCNEEEATIPLIDYGSAYQLCNLAEKVSKSFVAPDINCFNLPVGIDDFEKILVFLAQQIKETQLHKSIVNYDKEMKVLFYFNQSLSYKERQAFNSRIDNCDQYKSQTIINARTQQVKIKGKIYSLGGNSWKLMRLLFEKRNEIVSHEEIINKLWNNYEQLKISPGPENVSTEVKRLRDKIEDLKPFKYILTRRNEEIGYSGYMFNDSQ